MNLQNGYKVIYEKAADGMRTFYASKTGFFADAEVIAEAEIGKYKLIYERNGQFFGSETGIPSEDDYCFNAFDKVFVEQTSDEAPSEEPEVEVGEEPNAPEVKNEPEVEITGVSGDEVSEVEIPE